MTTSSNTPIKPFLRWAGGKRRILGQLLARTPQNFTAYVEPFLGAGTMLFAIDRPVPKLGNDLNESLIETYLVVRDHLSELLQDLSRHKNENAYYYEIRQLDRNPDFADFSSLNSKVARASRFIFLNRTCFNGLYRVNSKGHFNVPFGNVRYDLAMLTADLIAASEYLNQRDENGKFLCEFTSQDFEQCIKNARPGSFIYLDPPYEAISPTSSFASYHKSGFTMDDQIRLLKAASSRDDCFILISNAAAATLVEALQLFPNFHVDQLKVSRSISAKGASRVSVDELLIANNTLVDSIRAS